MINDLKKALNTIKAKKPIILNLTNYVTMDLMANILLAIGASPIMSVAREEFEELVNISSALNINIGTLDDSFIKNSEIAAKAAAAKKIPIILDPTGVGASNIRNEAGKLFSNYANIIRGNASEIIALGSSVAQSGGVDSINTTDQAETIALKIATEKNCTIVVSGSIDLVLDRQKSQKLQYGSPIMSSVTGMGCALNSVIAAFSAVMSDKFEAALFGVAYFSLCGNLAANVSNKPGSFKVAFIDELSTANFDKMMTLC
jgi:hydroxyethylthiazole kinase